jgi:hypothetical protein
MLNLKNSKRLIRQNLHKIMLLLINLNKLRVKKNSIWVLRKHRLVTVNHLLIKYMDNMKFRKDIDKCISLILLI